MELHKDGRAWRIGTASEAEWLQGRPVGRSVATAMPLVFDAYATVLRPDGIRAADHERAVVAALRRHGGDQAWWLGYLDTGAHDVVFPDAPRVQLYWDWPYVIVRAGSKQALAWRTGHMRDGTGSLPDLLFPEDRSWLVTALWDDAWTCVGGPDVLVQALEQDPFVSARRVAPDETLPPG